MNLNQITIHVTDLDQSINFYQILGLKLIVHSLDNRYARFECPDHGTTFSLHENEHVTPGSVSFYFEVDDVDSRVADLKSHGLVFDTAPKDQRWLWREAWTRDPNGYRIGIYKAGENRRFPPWRLNDKD